MSYSTELLCFSYACSVVPEQITQQLRYSNKVLLPPSVLHDISNNENISFPLFFNIQNKENKLSRVCAVHEFTAPLGICNIPYYIMAELGMKEGENMLIATPKIIDSYIKKIPKGIKIDIKTLRKDLALKYNADTTFFELPEQDIPITKGFSPI